jgi:hypothetical protein
VWGSLLLPAFFIFIFYFFYGNVEDGFSWAFVGAHEPNSDCVRRYLWKELTGLLSWWNFSWCIWGYFNVTRFLLVKD